MGFPWKPDEMTWVHHAIYNACEKRIAEKQGHRVQGAVTNVVGSSLFDQIEGKMSQR